MQRADGVDAVIHIKTGPGVTALLGQALGSTMTDAFKDFPN